MDFIFISQRVKTRCLSLGVGILMGVFIEGSQATLEYREPARTSANKAENKGFL
jgi:hypothetical protein